MRSTIRTTRVLVNFATARFFEAQQLNAATGLNVGGFDRVISYSPHDIDRDFRIRNRAVLRSWTGAGYWLDRAIARARLPVANAGSELQRAVSEYWRAQYNDYDDVLLSFPMLNRLVFTFFRRATILWMRILQALYPQAWSVD